MIEYLRKSCLMMPDTYCSYATPIPTQYITHPYGWKTALNELKIVYYVPRRTMRVNARRATMLAGDRSQGVVET